MQYDAIERNKKPVGSLDVPDDFRREYLNIKDRQMRFCNAKDPIYYVFNKIEERPLSDLFRHFVKDAYKDSRKFLQKLVA